MKGYQYFVNYRVLIFLQGVAGQPGDPGRAGEIGFDVGSMKIISPIK